MSNLPDQLLDKIKQTEGLLKNFKALECLEKIREYQNSVDQTCHEYKNKQNEKEHELERELEVLKVMETELAQDYQDLMKKNETYLKDEEELEGYAEKLGTEIEELNREIELLEGQLIQPNNLYSVDPQPFDLVQAVFEGIGVRAKMESNRVTQVELTSYKERHSLVLDVTKYSNAFITNYTWNYLSSGVDSL
ncbi:hypothetical protein BY458DRAFT_433338 [Sporodiniella umbellata]|nr:hypothetical protein BY458DRAFT_433338 [Sporodiniella umbellata]